MDQEFVKTAWEGIRDLANMLFIFVLIWMAIATVLNLSGHNAKATLVKLIIAALLINFSLFTSRVIIDAGNISALFFYDALAVGNTQNLTGTDAGNALNSNFLTEAGKGLPIKGVSTALMTTINPQEMITGTKPGLGDDMNKLIFIYVASIVLLLWMAWVFFTTSFLFLSRIAILWVLMAVSPIMFVGGIVPGGIKNYSKQLWGELIGKSFCITIFLFFVWLAVLFANPAGATLFVKDTSGLNFIEFIVVLALKFGIIIVILDMGKKQTKKQCDSVMGTSIDIGKKLMGVAGMAGGLAIGGAAGSVLRNVVGGGAMRNLESVGADGLTGRQRLASGGAGSRLQLRAMEGLERSSFDIRKSGMGKYGNMNKGIGGLGMGRGEGGFAGQVEQKQKYYTSLKKKLGDVTDKDPTKALAAQGASKRFEEQMDKESSAWLSKNIQTGSAYYKLLKHIAGGGKSSLSGSPMTEANAVKNLASFGQQITSEARNTVAKGFGSSTGVAKARAAQEVARENQKALKTAEQSAQLQKERDAQLKEYEDLKKKHSSLSRADATPTEWKGSAEKNIGTLEESIEKLTRTIKETEKDEQNLSTRVTAIMAQRSGQTDSTARNRMSTELKELEEQKETVSRTLSQTQDALREEKKGLEEMKTLVKLSENMNRFAQQDVADYKASQK